MHASSSLIIFVVFLPHSDHHSSMSTLRLDRGPPSTPSSEVLRYYVKNITADLYGMLLAKNSHSDRVWTFLTGPILLQEKNSTYNTLHGWCQHRKPIPGGCYCAVRGYRCIKASLNYTSIAPATLRHNTIHALQQADRDSQQLLEAWAIFWTRCPRLQLCIVWHYPIFKITANLFLR